MEQITTVLVCMFHGSHPSFSPPQLLNYLYEQLETQYAYIVLFIYVCLFGQKRGTGKSAIMDSVIRRRPSFQRRCRINWRANIKKMSRRHDHTQSLLCGRNRSGGRKLKFHLSYFGCCFVVRFSSSQFCIPTSSHALFTYSILFPKYRETQSTRCKYVLLFRLCARCRRFMQSHSVDQR